MGVRGVAGWRRPTSLPLAKPPGTQRRNQTRPDRNPLSPWRSLHHAECEMRRFDPRHCLTLDTVLSSLCQVHGTMLLNLEAILGWNAFSLWSEDLLDERCDPILRTRLWDDPRTSKQSHSNSTGHTLCPLAEHFKIWSMTIVGRSRCRPKPAASLKEDLFVAQEDIPVKAVVCVVVAAGP